MAVADQGRPVLVAGDANVDLVLTGDVVPRFGQAEQLVDDGRLVLGGSAAIAACGLARLGVPTALVARVGDDAFGRFTLEALSDAGVDTSLVAVDRHLPTGCSVILSTPADRAILTVSGTIGTLTGDDVLAAADRYGVGHLHVASYFLQPVLARDLPRVLAHVRSRGTTTSLDTNWDPAGEWAGLGAVLAELDVLLPNVAELRALAASLGITGADDEEVALGMAALGPRVVVKDGADGGWSADPGGRLARAGAVAVDVVDTTGAGDSFDAGYLAALTRGIDDEAERLRWAATAGSLSTLGTGGTGHQPTELDLRRAWDRPSVGPVAR